MKVVGDDGAIASGLAICVEDSVPSRERDLNWAVRKGKWRSPRVESRYLRCQRKPE